MNSLQRALLIVTLFGMMTVWRETSSESCAQTSESSTHDAPTPEGAARSSFRRLSDPTQATDLDFFEQEHTTGPGYRSFQRSTGHFSRQRDQVVVIPTSAALIPALPEVVEDMSVMSHILLRGLERSTLSLLNLRSGFADFGEFFRQDQDMEAIFVEDYGALFLITVDFPLSASVENGSRTAPPNSQVDTTWEEVRQEITSPGTQRRPDSLSRGPAYDAERIEQVKTELVKNLKYASNIRHLPPESWITVRLSNGSGSSGFAGQMMTGSTFAGGGGGFGVGGMASAGAGFSGSMAGFGYGDAQGAPNPLGATTLCVRVRKSDAQAFAEGTLDIKTFQEKVQVMTY